MGETESFDFMGFVSSLQAAPQAERQEKVREELKRLRQMVVRESSTKFKHQIYMRRVERLSRFLDGDDVSKDLTPTEIDAYALLMETKPAAAKASVATPEPVAVVTAPAPVVVEAPAAPAAEKPIAGADRRQSRRIQMKMKVFIRRDSDKFGETLEPINVSRGGIGFESVKHYSLHEIIWVTLHYRPEEPDSMATRSLIVRAAPQQGSPVMSYGVKFLPA